MNGQKGLRGSSWAGACVGGGVGKVLDGEGMERWREGDGVVGRELEGRLLKGFEKRIVGGKKRNVTVEGLVWVGS